MGHGVIPLITLPREIECLAAVMLSWARTRRAARLAVRGVSLHALPVEIEFCESYYAYLARAHRKWTPPKGAGAQLRTSSGSPTCARSRDSA
jgi:hypothetical protein